MRLAAYSDDPYARAGDGVRAVMPFALFLSGLNDHLEQVVLLGRVSDTSSTAAVMLPPGQAFAQLPWWEDLSRPASVLRATPGSLRAFWRVLGEVDGVLLFGPSPLGLAFAALARLRGRRVVLGVRMDYVSYIAHRHPGRRSLTAFARALDGSWRLLARRAPTVVVGDELARRYAASPRLLSTWISLVRDADVHDPGRDAPGTAGPIRILTVGRVDTEKNPLLLADIMARLREDGRDWRLTVCGDGPLLDALAERTRELGVAEHVELRGFVGPSDGLNDLYLAADMFLHVSWTEGMPQVLVEAWARALPVVATDVGGVRDAVGTDGGLLIRPGDPEAAVAALRRIADDGALRGRLRDAGLARARARTLERETARVADFVCS